MSVFATLKNSLPPLLPDPSQALLTMPDDSGAANTQLQNMASAPKKSVIFAPTPQYQEQQHLGDALTRDYQKDAHPFGSPDNHPGVFGKILHGLNYATGGTNRRAWEEQGLEKRLNDLVAEKARNDYENAEIGKTKEETAEMPAESAARERLENAEANKDTNPTEPVHYLETDQGFFSYDPASKQLTPLTVGGKPLMPFQKPTAPKGAHFIQREVGGKPHTIAVDDTTGEDIKDEGETGEKPPTVNVNSGNTELDREATRLGKGWDTANTQANSQLEKIQDAENMIAGNAEAQAVGIPKVLTALVSGQGSGVRITMPELQMIAKARGLEGNVEGTLNKWAGQGQLTDTQKGQLHGILEDVKARILEKQAIVNRALDSINGAKSRDDINNADKMARQQMNELERYGHYAGEDVTLNGQTVTIKKIHPDGTFEY